MRPFELSSSPVRTSDVRPPLANAVIAWVVGGIVFVFRLAAIRQLPNDHYMHLAWAQQVLFGLLPGRDFVDPGMPLAWGLSAIVQAISPGPFSEAVLSAAMFGVTATLTVWVVTRLTGSLTAGVFAAMTAAALVPRSNDFPKLLVPALTMYLLNRYVEVPSSARRIAIGLGLVAAVLFRHDLGLYACVVAVATIAITHRDTPYYALRALLLIGGATALLLSPYLGYVWWSEGLFEHVRRGLEFSRGESHQLQYPWPTFPSLIPGGGTWSREDATAFLYYLAWLLPLASLARFRSAARVSEQDRLPLALAATLFLALYLPIILRDPIDERLSDIATPLVVVGAFVGFGALRASLRTAFDRHRNAALRIWAGAAAGVVAGILLAATLNAAHLGQLTREIEETRIERGPRGVVSKIRSVYEDGTNWPWSAFWPNSGGFPTAALYIRACTSPDAYVLLTWPSPEYFFFAQRKFASGHSMFLPPDAFITERDQEFMVSRLREERPPIALVDKTRIEEFRRAYPMVDAYIGEHYTQAASYRHYDNDEIAIEIRNDLRATSTFGSQDWPCGLVSAPHP